GFQVDGVEGREEVVRSEMARAEADRRAPFDAQLGAVRTAQLDPARGAVMAVLLRQDVRDVLVSDGALVAADEGRGLAVCVALPRPLTEPLELLERRIEDEQHADPRQVAQLGAELERV